MLSKRIKKVFEKHTIDLLKESKDAEGHFLNLSNSIDIQSERLKERVRDKRRSTQNK